MHEPVHQVLARATAAASLTRAAADVRRAERDADVAAARALERRLMALIAEGLDRDEVDPTDARALLPALRKIAEQP